MNDFESIVRAEIRKGWYPKLIAATKGWTCALLCGVDVLPANIPRPMAGGITAMAALVAAVRERDRAVGKSKAASN